jgi:hypothetical protein
MLWTALGQIPIPPNTAEEKQKSPFICAVKSYGITEKISATVWVDILPLTPSTLRLGHGQYGNRCWGNDLIRIWSPSKQTVSVVAADSVNKFAAETSGVKEIFLLCFPNNETLMDREALEGFGWLGIV